MDTVRIARDFGTVSQVLPKGVRLIDAPHPFVNAVRHALTYLSWIENLPSEEVPPRRIWLNEERLEEWFKAVKKKKEEDRKVQSGDHIEGWDGDMKSNDAASLLITE